MKKFGTFLPISDRPGHREQRRLKPAEIDRIENRQCFLGFGS